MTSGRYSLTCLLVAEIEQHELADTEKRGVISQWTAAFLVPVAYGVVSPAFAAMFQVGSTFISLTELSWTGWKQKRGRRKLSSLSRYTAWKQSYIHHAKKEVTINTKERRSNYTPSKRPVDRNKRSIVRTCLPSATLDRVSAAGFFIACIYTQNLFLHCSRNRAL